MAEKFGHNEFKISFSVAGEEYVPTLKTGRLDDSEFMSNMINTSDNNNK
jgi:hypothetical protein